MSSFDDDDDYEPDFDDAGDDSLEAHVWQLLLLINPGDEEAALQQFTAYRELLESGEEDGAEPVELVGRVIDWHSGFQVQADDLRTLVQAIDELCARWNLAIDWGGEPDDEEFFDELDAPALLATAYDRLAEFGYTLWLWETDRDSYAGWITLTRDNEPLREVATRLGINMRLGSEAS